MLNKPLFDLPRLLVVSSRRLARQPIYNILKNLCAAHAPWILLREDHLPIEAQRELAVQLMPHVGQTKISISDDVEFALRIGAHGIHVSADADLKAVRAVAKELIMGVHCHSAAEVSRAQDAGADYVTLSPIFVTASKPGYGPALGLETLRGAARDYDVPILALAGITLDNMQDCRDAGAHGVAVMGDIMRAENPVEMMREYQRSLST